MKLQQDSAPSQNMITAYGAGYVEINKERHARNLIVLPQRIVPWAAAGFATLSDADVRALSDLAPEIVLLGTGRSQRFPTPLTLRPLIDAGIGYEVMDLMAACRTYNILVVEGRKVAAALLLD